MDPDGSLTLPRHFGPVSMRGRLQKVVEMSEKLKLVKNCEGGSDEEHPKGTSNSHVSRAT